MSELGDSVTTLRRVLKSLAGAVAATLGLALYLHLTGEPPEFTEGHIIAVRTLTVLCYAGFAISFRLTAFLTERAAPRPGLAGLKTAAVIRSAVRGSCALLGAAACLLGAHSGVLRLLRFYWAAAIPGVLFALATLLTLPTEDSLREDLRAQGVL